MSSDGVLQLLAVCEYHATIAWDREENIFTTCACWWCTYGLFSIRNNNTVTRYRYYVVSFSVER